MKKIVIKKAARLLELFENGRLLKRYMIALGSCPIGHKQVEGDGKTPEGEYFVFVKNSKSKFHLSLGIAYPSMADAREGLRSALICAAELEDIENAACSRTMPPQKTALGGEIYIHGGGTAGDWTEGCIALANEDIEELFGLVAVGTTVSILA